MSLVGGIDPAIELSLLMTTEKVGENHELEVVATFSICSAMFIASVKSKIMCPE